MRQLVLFALLMLIFTLPLRSTLPAQAQSANPAIITRANAERVQQIAVLKGSKLDTVTDVIISPDSHLAALRNRFAGSPFEVWDLATLSLKYTLTPETNDPIWNTGFSSDGNVIAIQQDRLIQTWDTATGKLLFTITTQDKINLMQLIPQSNLLAYVTVPDDKTADGAVVHVWDLKAGKEIEALEHPTVQIFAVDVEGKFLASGGTDGSIRLWSLMGSSANPNFKVVREKTGQTIWNLAFVGDHDLYFTVGDDYPGDFLIWDDQRSELQDSNRDFSFPISQDILATRLSDGSSFQLWNVMSGENLALYTGRGLHVTATLDQGVLATTGERNVNLFDAGNGEILKTIDCTTLCFSSFSPDSHYLAVWGTGNTISLWGISP